METASAHAAATAATFGAVHRFLLRRFDTLLSASCFATAVYAGVNLYHWFLEKQGSYGVSVKIDAGDAAKKTVLPDEVPEVDLSATFMASSFDTSSPM